MLTGVPVSYGLLAASYVVIAGGLAWVLRRLAKAHLRLPGEPEADLGPNHQPV